MFRRPTAVFTADAAGAAALTRALDDARDDDLPHLHRFVRGLCTDLTAVINRLTLSHSSGAVEGAVNRIKMIRRQMYGRAKLDLRHARILHAP
jgi:transposase